MRIDGQLPAEVPSGYHRMSPDDSAAFDLIVSPGLARLPSHRMWGFSAQLYAARSSRSWGVGDLRDLAELGRWSSELGAGMLLVNPLHAADLIPPLQPSPYYPSSRCFSNPIYIAVDEVPGCSGARGLGVAEEAGWALNAERLLDRDRVWQLKSAVLEEIFGAGVDEASLEAYRRARGEALELFATFSALREIHQGSWPQWPTELRHPRSEAVEAFRRSPAGENRIRYHAWLQYLFDEQMSLAGRTVGVVTDLAVGVDPLGADAWIWQDVVSLGMSVGAPPDEFATLGQDWGLPPFDPWRLRSAGYQPLIEALRGSLSHGAGLRVDHVMGLFRLYWMPRGEAADRGAYVRYPHHDMLNILTLEAERAGAYLVGEDLGTVEDEVRSDLAQRHVMAYRVWWFEDQPASTWPELALGTVTTHDLPTVAGVLSGADLEAQRRLGLSPNEESSAALRAKLVERTGWLDGEEVTETVRRVHDDLAQAPCLLLAAGLEDALALEERPNMPGTVDEWPNWRVALPLPLEEIERSPLVEGVAHAMSRTDDSAPDDAGQDGPRADSRGT
jgi:4-alpha-glucanotransferase